MNRDRGNEQIDRVDGDALLPTMLSEIGGVGPDGGRRREERHQVKLVGELFELGGRRVAQDLERDRLRQMSVRIENEGKDKVP